MRRAASQDGPSSLERFLGGDTHRGAYVPPLMAEVMKQMQAEQRATEKAAATPAAQDAYSGPTTPPARVPLSAETEARLDSIAKAPSLDDAFKQMQKWPELRLAVRSEGLAEIASYPIENRDERAQEVATSLILEGKSGGARYYGSELTLYAGVLGNTMAVGARLDKLFGYSDMRSNRFGTQYERSEKRVRTGLFAHLPFSTGPKELARFVPELSPASLAEKLAEYLSTPR